MDEIALDNLNSNHFDEIDISTPVYFPCLLCYAWVNCCCLSLKDISSALCCRCCFQPPRPSWNIPFEVASKILRNVIRTTPKKQGSVTIIRLLGDGGLPPWSPLLPYGVKSSRGKHLDSSTLPSYEWVYPKSDGLPDFKPSISPDISLNKNNDRKYILYFHGGGFIMGGRGSHRIISHELCKKTGATVLMIEYKRAPEFKHPVAENDCLDCYKWLIKWVDSNNILLGGDSAGGALVVNVLSLIKEQNIPMPKGGILLSPWVDWFDINSESMQTNVCFDYIEPLAAKLTIKLFVDQPINYYSPTYKDLSGFPPLLIEYGDCEVLRDQIKVFINKAIEANVSVKSNCYPDMIHVFQIFSITGMTVCQESYNNIDSFIKELYDSKI